MKTKQPKSQAPKWSDVRKTLVKWEASELVDLIKELHGLSAGNRDFLHTRLAPDADNEKVLQPYLDQIKEEFYPLHGYGKARPAVVRNVIRAYRKASGNAAGTAELMLTYVETGTFFARDCHVNDERFYDSLGSVLGELASLLVNEPVQLYLRFRERLLDVEEQAARMGWGYGEQVAELVGKLEDEFADRT